MMFRLRMRAIVVLAVLFAVTAGCDSTTAPTPMAPETFEATFDGGLGNGPSHGRARLYDKTRLGGIPQFFVELVEERSPGPNILVRFTILGQWITPGTHTVGGNANENALDADAFEFRWENPYWESQYHNFSGTMRVEKATAGEGLQASFDIRSGTLHATGRFNAVMQ
jgi:hypothetical protein